MTEKEIQEMQDKMKKFEDDNKACMEENKTLKAKLKKYEDGEQDKSKLEADKSCNEAEKKKFEDEKSKLEQDKSKLEEDKKKFSKEQEDLAAEKKSMHEASKKDFFKLHAKRFLPVDLKAQEMMYDTAAQEGKLDEFKSDFAKRPESGIFSEYAMQTKDLEGDPSAKPVKKIEDEVETSSYAAGSDNAKISKYCKDNGMNPDDNEDWQVAMLATGSIKYTKPLPLDAVAEPKK